jgi:F0F1-type ATP synthase membrane subunit b/b'
MPQINFYTFLSQTTWTIILFYIFYFSMKQYILPLVFENIKLKMLTINSNIDNKNNINSVSSFNNTYNTSLSQIVNNN